MGPFSEADLNRELKSSSDYAAHHQPDMNLRKRARRDDFRRSTRKRDCRLLPAADDAALITGDTPVLSATR